MRARRFTVFFAGFLLLVFPALANTATLLILHTNDLHDHIRPGYEGVGGLPYVSGYVKSVQAERKDTLLLDAGDVMEKGDMVAFASESLAMYEALGKIGYAAIAVGNHDANHRADHLRKAQAQMPNTALLCLNWRDKTGTPYFPASKVFEVNGIKVAVIGLTVPKGREFMSTRECAQALEAEAERLKPETHLQVALCHFGSKDAEVISELAPEVDVFVTGHTHELLSQPVVVKETGALIVQAGSYAHYVGRLELSVDLDAKKIVQSKGEPIELRHDAVPCDQALADWVKQREQELCPGASRVIGRCTKPLGTPAVARLAAEALRKRSGADVAFCHAGTIIRSGLPAGDVDVNALFVAGGQRGLNTVSVMLTGKEIKDYLEKLMGEDKGLTQVSGIEATVKRSGKNGDWKTKSSLKKSKNYRVVLPELEWETRFLKVMKNSGTEWKTEPCGFTFTEAVTDYVEALTKAGTAIDAEAARLDN